MACFEENTNYSNKRGLFEDRKGGVRKERKTNLKTRRSVRRIRHIITGISHTPNKNAHILLLLILFYLFYLCFEFYYEKRRGRVCGCVVVSVAVSVCVFVGGLKPPHSFSSPLQMYKKKKKGNVLMRKPHNFEHLYKFPSGRRGRGE